MAEVTYLKHIIKNHQISKNTKNLCEHFLSLKTEKELKEFAKKLNINITNSSFEELKEKIAFELIEKCFKDRNKNMEQIT